MLIVRAYKNIRNKHLISEQITLYWASICATIQCAGSWYVSDAKRVQLISHIICSQPHISFNITIKQQFFMIFCVREGFFSLFFSSFVLLFCICPMCKWVKILRALYHSVVSIESGSFTKTVQMNIWHLFSHPHISDGSSESKANEHQTRWKVADWTLLMYPLIWDNRNHVITCCHKKSSFHTHKQNQKHSYQTS